MNANDLFKAVMELDLTPIKTKLMHVASGEGWTLEKTNAVEKEYRRFLCLMKLFPEEDTAPLVDVDTFWHYHILDTMKYAADCEHAFGYFLHHYPYIGLDGTEEDERFRLDSGERMRTLYESIFGETYPESIEGAPASLAATAYCASPAPGIAYCASPAPGTPVSKAAGFAYCASPAPGTPVGKASSIAYCASPAPGTPASKGSGIAYCASPAPGTPASKAAGIAYCASPAPGTLASKASSVAYCASPAPGTPASKGSSVAYCASPAPGKPSAKAGKHAGSVLRA